MEGVERAGWSRGSGKDKKIYINKNNFLESVTYFWGSKTAESQQIAIGVYKYDFSCLIPANAPYSLEGRHGFVRFKVDANLDIPWAIDLNSEVAFSVMRQDDLNLFPYLKNPVEVEELEVFCTWTCNSDPVILTLQSPKQGYGVGEEIPVRASMVNKSTIKIYRTTLTLERLFKSSVGENFIEECVQISQKECRGVDAGERTTFNERFVIPRNAYTSTDKFCHIFKVMYRIELKVFTDSDESKLHLPITVGNIGFRDVQTAQPSAPVEQVVPVESFTPVPASAPVEVREDLDLRKKTNKKRK